MQNTKRSKQKKNSLLEEGCTQVEHEEVLGKLNSLAKLRGFLHFSKND